MSLTKLSLTGNNLIIPGQGEVGSWHPGWGQENDNLFFNSAKLFNKARRSERFPVFCLSICREIAYKFRFASWKLKIHWKKVDIKGKDKRTSISTVRDQYPTYASFPTYLVLSTLIKKKIKFSAYLRKFRMEQLQSHIWLTTFSYMGKYLQISHIIRKPFLKYDFASAPLWISLYSIWWKFYFIFLSVYRLYL